MKLRLLLLVMLVAGMNARGQNSVTNVTQSLTYQTLTDAVTSANNFDALVVGAGSYLESVTIDKNLTITTATGVSVTSLTFSNASTVTLMGSLTVTTSLALGNGFLLRPTATDAVIMSSGATVTRVTGYVNGALEKNLDVASLVIGAYISVKFEIGDALGYTPVDLSLYHLEVGSGSFRISTTGGEFTDVLSPSCVNPLQSVNRKYTIINNGMVFNNYAAKFTFLNADIDAGADYHMFRVAALDLTTGGWEALGIQLSYPNDITAVGQIFTQHEFYIGEQVIPVQTVPAPGATGVYPTCRLMWNAAVGATSYLFQLFLDPNKTPLKDTRTSDIYYDVIYPHIALGYDTTYYWRVKAAYGNITSDWSPIDSFKVGTPDSVIDNNIVHMHMRHMEGRIDSLRYKQGSNRELLYQALNTSMKGGLNRVNNETGTKCTNWNITNVSPDEGSAVFDYYASYGTKHVEMTWRTDIGFEMVVTHSFGGASRFTPGVYWSPGGDVGPQYDYITVIDPTGKKIVRYSGYPGKDSVLYNGLSLGSGIADSRFDETFGFKSSLSDSLYAATGVALNGPYSRTAYQGAVTREFAIKPASAYWAWVNQLQEPFFNISAADGGATWFSGSQQSLTWMSRNDFLDSLVNVKLSTDGGKTFPITIAQSIPCTGSSTINVPANVSSTNCRIRLELAGHPEFNGMNPANFIIRPLDAVVFSAPPTVVSAPGEKFIFPYYIDPNGKSIYAFETRIMFNKNMLSLAKYRIGANLPAGWVINVNDSSARGFIQIGGLCRKDSLDFPIQYADTAIVFTFNVKTTARVGGADTLKIENLYLEAADVNAQPYPVSGNDCIVSFHSALSGRLSYYSNKKALGAGAVQIAYTGLGNAAMLPISPVTRTDTTGHFDFSPIPPGAAVMLSIVPSDSVGDLAIDTAITAGDALLAFQGRDGGPTTITGYQKIAADVNGDGHVSSTDAFAILQRATGGLTSFKSIDVTGGRGNWVFVDSAYKMSAFNWQSAPQLHEYNPLDTSRLKENFYGILLGDVLPTYAGKAMSLAKDVSGSEFASTDAAFASGPVQFSVPKMMAASIGDTISIPLTLNANKNPMGSFNATVKFNNTVLKYAGKFVRNTKLTGFTGWTVEVAGSNEKGKVSVGAADLEQKMNPITGTGDAVTLKFVVLGTNKWVDSSDIVVTNMSATDTVAALLSVAGINGKIVTTGMAGVPATYALMQNYPNPFNPSTHISFALPEQGLASVVVYNVLGQVVRSYGTQQLAAGYHEVVWDARNNDNVAVASGAYFYRLTVVSASGTKFNDVKRMMLLK
jgi:hypothetical protein